MNDLPLPLLMERILFWVATTIVSIDAYQVIFHRGIPNIRTPKAIQQQIIEMMKRDMEEKKAETYTIVDLGSGNGQVTRSIAKAIPHAKVVGVEITRQSIWWANWRKKRNHLTNLEYRRMSFYDFNFAEADAVVMYLLPSALTTIGEKLIKEARPHTFISAYRFPLGAGWKPEKKIDAKSLTQRNLYIYRKENDKDLSTGNPLLSD